MFFLGNLVYVLCLFTNALAILSDDRFLARIGLSPTTFDPAFGPGADSNSVKAKLVALIASVRMVMRRTSLHLSYSLLFFVLRVCMYILVYIVHGSYLRQKFGSHTELRS
jgi:hypothetical protein